MTQTKVSNHSSKSFDLAEIQYTNKIAVKIPIAHVSFSNAKPNSKTLVHGIFLTNKNNKDKIVAPLKEPQNISSLKEIIKASKTLRKTSFALQATVILYY